MKIPSSIKSARKLTNLLVTTLLVVNLLASTTTA